MFRFNNSLINIFNKSDETNNQNLSKKIITLYTHGFLSEAVNTTSEKNEPKHKTLNDLDITNNETQYDEISLDPNNEIKQSATVNKNHESDNEEWVMINTNNEIKQSATVNKNHESDNEEWVMINNEIEQSATVNENHESDNEKWVMADSQLNLNYIKI